VLQPVGGLPPVLTLGTGLRVLPEVFGRGLVIGAAGFVVAAAYSGVEDVVIVIHVGREAVRALTAGTSEPGGFPGILAEVIPVVHGLVILEG